MWFEEISYRGFARELKSVDITAAAAETAAAAAAAVAVAETDKKR